MHSTQLVKIEMTHSYSRALIQLRPSFAETQVPEALDAQTSQDPNTDAELPDCLIVAFELDVAY